MAELVDVTITAPDVEWLTVLTRSLVEDGLAASGNIVPEVRSIYRWQGEIAEAIEAMVTLHTRGEHVTAIIERVNDRHPYQTPHVLVHPVVEANPPYREWVIASTQRVP